MKRFSGILFLFFVALVCVVPSCTKKETAETRLTRMQHKWKLIKTATDANGNGVIDASEIQPVQSGVTTITFNKDLSGVETIAINGVTTDYPFIWAMDGTLDTVTRNGVGHNQIKYFLADISSTNMELTTTTDLGLAAYFYAIN